MTQFLNSIHPKIKPPLDDGFLPPALYNRVFQNEVAQVGIPVLIGLERSPKEISRYETQVFPDEHPRASENLIFIERVVKFLLWQRGAYRLYFSGPHQIGEYLQSVYSPLGERQFDHRFLGQQVYKQPFSVQICDPAYVPAASEVGKAFGRHLDGCRVGFDLGASDRKVSAVIDGQAVFSQEMIWSPGTQTDPEYHYREIMSAIKLAASKLPRVDAIGGSSAGIYIDNRPMVASLFRGVPADRFHEIEGLFERIQAEMGVPLIVINDGDVAALAGSMSLEKNGVLGIAMGSSEAAGYVDPEGNILGWLNELGFAPVDLNPSAPREAWSGDRGVGSKYFSQQCVFRLAPKAGIQIPVEVTNAEKLIYVQEKLKAGHKGAQEIWESMGVYLGYSLAHYADFYDIQHVLVLGRCTSGLGGELLMGQAQKVIQLEFPTLNERITLQLPDEKTRRVGQSIAAASLPSITSRDDREG
jgi:predicted NBD/HSP70 family sugar kinase